jgi:hypothetical protein
MRCRAINVAFVAILVVGAVVLATAVPDRGKISIGFIRYSVKGGGEIWAEYAVTNHSRFDYAISVKTDPHVSREARHALISCEVPSCYRPTRPSRCAVRSSPRASASDSWI